eukprot:gene9149-12356_t
MYYDPVRSAYIDAEDGSVVLHEAVPELSSTFSSPAVRSTSSQNSTSGRSGKLKSKSNSPELEVDIEMIQVMDLDANAVRSQLLELSRLEKLNNSHNKEKNSYSMPTIAMAPNALFDGSDGTSVESLTTDPVQRGGRSNAASSENDDWIFARALQAMEFEISNEMIMEEGYEEGEDGDFNQKEYQASRSCKTQLLTLSAFLCVLQIGVMIATIQMGGYASQKENPMIGPP